MVVEEEEEEGMRLVDGVGKTVLSGPACARSVLCRGAFRKDPSARQGREPERNVGRRYRPLASPHLSTSCALGLLTGTAGRRRKNSGGLGVHISYLKNRLPKRDADWLGPFDLIGDKSVVMCNCISQA
jgi:hypothetical protein